MHPLISAVMLTYNRPVFVRKSIELFQAQTWPNKELVIVDDGPPGTVPDALPINVRHVRVDRAWITKKRTLGYREANGDFFAGWDDDDYFGPRRLETQVEFLLAGKSDVCGFPLDHIVDVPQVTFHRFNQVEGRAVRFHDGTAMGRASLFLQPAFLAACEIGGLYTGLVALKESGHRLADLPNDGNFVYVRHPHSVWANTLDLKKSGRVSGPPKSLPLDMLEFWRDPALADQGIGGGFYDAGKAGPTVMSRSALAGTRLNQIAGSQTRKPRAQVLVVNPRRTTMNAVVNGSNAEPWVDLSGFTESVRLNWNVGYESDDNPSVPSCEISLKRSINRKVNLREGFVQDGIIIQIRVGDDRVRMSDWEPVFTGRIRGEPANDEGTRGDRSEGITVVAYGREADFLALKVTTESKPAGTDLGEIVFQVATQKMGLTQGEVLIGALGVLTLHETNQLVDEPALSALWHCLFPAGKKPMFDGRGRLVAVSYDLDKSATRIYSEGNFVIRSMRKEPNESETNNSVSLFGQDHNLTKLLQEAQQLNEVMPTIGFFEKEYSERHYFSDDHKQRAEASYLVTRTRIKFSSGRWKQQNEFSGRLMIDSHWLQAARIIIFVTWLAAQLAVVLLDLLMDSGVSGNTPLVTSTGPTTIAIWRAILSTLAQVAMAFLLWAMQFIGRGRYQIWGKPYENAYRELQVRAQLPGLQVEQVREREFRNAFISDMTALRLAAVERLRRELVKNHVYSFEMLDDPVLEVDDVIQTYNGDRFYIITMEREIARNAPPTMRVTAWKVWSDHLKKARNVVATTGSLGYGYGFGTFWGDQF